MAATLEHKKGGYDYEFVSPPPKSLECPVCLLTLRDPHVISCCSYEFCKVCIKHVQKDGKPCPLCDELAKLLHNATEESGSRSECFINSLSIERAGM